MNVTREYDKWLFLVLMLLFTGCAATLKQAIYLDSGFQPQEINEITFLPALDARIDKKVKVNTEKQLREAGIKIMKKKGYQIVLSNNIGGVEQITDDDLKSGDAKWIKQLGPEKTRWVMELVLIDCTTKLTFGSTGNAEVEGFLFDKETGKIVWRDKGIGQSGQGGLFGMILKGTMDEAAISLAIQNLFTSIPKKSKK